MSNFFLNVRNCTINNDECILTLENGEKRNIPNSWLFAKKGPKKVDKIFVKNGHLAIDKIYGLPPCPMTKTWMEEKKSVYKDWSDLICEDESFDPEILILGTLPGGKTLEENTGKDHSFSYYYAGRNNFWRILSILFPSVENKETWDFRKNVLLRHKIILWDIFESAWRFDVENGEIKESSKDACIKDGNENEIDRFLQLHSKITQIIVNGMNKRSKTCASAVLKKYLRDKYGGQNDEYYEEDEDGKNACLHLKGKRSVKIRYLQSTSNSNRRLTIDEVKKNGWNGWRPTIRGV